MRKLLGLLLSICAFGLARGDGTVVYVNAVGGSTFTDEAGNYWNNADFANVNQYGPMKDRAGNVTPIKVWVLQPYAGSNSNAKGPYTGDAAEFEAVRAKNGGKIYFCSDPTWGSSRRLKMQARVKGLDPAKFYTFTFVGSRANSFGDYSSTYTVEGATSGSDWLMAANNVDKVARVPGIAPRPDGTIDFTVAGRASSVQHFGYLQAFKIEASDTPPDLPARDIYVDCAGSASADSARTWNNVSFTTPDNAKDNLLDSAGQATMVGISVTKAGGTNGSASSALTGDAAEFNAAHTGSNQVYGNTATFDNAVRNPLTATIRGLDPARRYTFMFMASRMGSSNNLTTRYTVTGGNTGSAELDAANNVDKVAVVSGIMPNADGTVAFEMTKGTGNNHASGFFYLLAMKITAEAQPAAPAGSRRVVVAATAGGSVAVTKDGAAAGPENWLQAGENVVATATAEPGWRFAAWTSDWTNAPVTTASMTIPAGQHVTWTAVFEKDAATTAKTVWVDAYGTAAADTKSWNKFENLFRYQGVQSNFVAGDGSWTPLVVTMEQEAGLKTNGAYPNNSSATSAFTGDAAPFEAARKGTSSGQQVFLAINHKESSTVSCSNVLEVVYDVAGLKPDSLYTFRFIASRMGAAAANYDTRYRAVGANSVSAGLNPSNNVDRVATLAYVRPTAEGTVRVSIGAGPDNTHGNLYYYLNAQSVTGDFEPATPSDARRILWFGNSFSLNGDIPKRVADLAEIAGYTRPLIVADLMGGKNLAYHIGEIKNYPANNVESPDLLAACPWGWDDVVIQGYSTEATDIYSPLPAEGFLPNATNLFDLVRRSSRGGNVRAVLYETWARQPANADFYPGRFADAYAMQAQISANYREVKNLVAREWGPDAVALAPAGRAFRALGFDPKLYASDLYHQGGIGQQLLAMVLFNRIYGVFVDDLVTHAQATAAGWTAMTEAEWNALVRAARSVYAPEGSQVLVR